MDFASAYRGCRTLPKLRGIPNSTELYVRAQTSGTVSAGAGELRESLRASQADMLAEFSMCCQTINFMDVRYKYEVY